MYNKRLKEAFISTLNSKSRMIIAERTFEYTEPFEENACKDLCMFSGDLLSDVVKGAVALRGGRNGTRVQIIRNYIKWSVANGVQGAVDGFSGITIPFTEECRRRMVSSPAHLQVCLDAYFDKEDKETVETVYRAYSWLLFCGVEADDVPHITISDVNIDKMTIRYNNKELSLYKEAIPSISSCIKSSSFLYYNPTYKEGVMRRDRISGTELVRGIRAVVKSKMFTKITTIRSKDASEGGIPRLSQGTIFLSGIFYRQYEIDRNLSWVPGYESTSKTFLDIVNDMPSKKSATRLARVEAAKDMYDNYQRWKIAFYM